MKNYLLFVLKRALQLLAVVFAGISAAFFISHLSPISPVETIIGRVAGNMTFSPEAIESLRATLTELFGTDRPLWEKYLNFWSRFVVGDLGPSLIAFPTPAMELVMLALPWTVGLLTVAIIISWLIGNILGGLAGYYQNNSFFKAFGIVAIGVQPIPYYIVAFLMVIVFGYFWPVLPISGGFALNVRPSFTPEFIFSVLRHAILPASSLVIVGLGTWFLGMRALVSNIGAWMQRTAQDWIVLTELTNYDAAAVGFSMALQFGPQLLLVPLTGVIADRVDAKRASASCTAAPCAPSSGRTSCARRCGRRASGGRSS